MLYLLYLLYTVSPPVFRCRFGVGWAKSPAKTRETTLLERLRATLWCAVGLEYGEIG